MMSFAKLSDHGSTILHKNPARISHKNKWKYKRNYGMIIAERLSYLCMPVSAFTAEIRALNPLRSITMGAKRTTQPEKREGTIHEQSDYNQS